MADTHPTITAFYLSDVCDSASAHLLAACGVSFVRAPPSGWAPFPTTWEGASRPAAAPPALFCNGLEASFPVPVAFTAPPSPDGLTHEVPVLDVRDSADAWVRVVLPPDWITLVAAGTKHRFVTAHTPIFPTAAVAAAAVPPLQVDVGALSSTRKLTLPLPLKTVASGHAVVWAAPAGEDGKQAPVAVVRSPSPPDASADLGEDVPHFDLPGKGPHPREIVSELCASFYTLGWVTGTGGSISIRHGGRTFMAPSGVQKERMQPQDIFVLDSSGAILYGPSPLPGKPKLKLSQCAPLFAHAFGERSAGACIHTHDVSAVMCTLQNEDAFRITHQEMIKGIAGHGFLDECAVPIIENTPHECDLADSLKEAMVRCVGNWGGGVGGTVTRGA